MSPPRTPATGDDMLTVAELAAWLRVPQNTIYAWRARRRGPRGTRVGRGVRFRRSDVETWLESNSDQVRR